MNSKTIQFEYEQASMADQNPIHRPNSSHQNLNVHLLLTVQSFPINTMQDNQKPTVSSSTDLQREVAELMIECLNLEVTADQITPDAPLYGDGLGLDSIDVLEVALVVSKRYGLQLRTDSEDNQHIFSSLRSLSDTIAAQRTR